MMVNKKKKKQAAKERHQVETTQESQGAEAATVAWLITVLSVAICDFGTGFIRLWLGPQDKSLGMLAGVLFFAALTIGLISLGLLQVVLRSRRVPPPRGLVVFGVTVSVIPWIALLLQLLVN